MSEALAGSRLVGLRMRGRRSPAILVLLLGLLCALLVALPAATVVTRSLDDLLLLFNGIHRVTAGQAPSRDFLTSLGPLTFYLPALAYGLTGSLGAALPLTLGVIVAVMAGFAWHVLGTRLGFYLALPFAAFLFLILAAPMNLGEPIAALSFTMFYNRVGWVALALLLVLYLKPRSESSTFRADAVTAALLTLFLLYMRATYGFVALIFLLLMLTDGSQRRWAATALLAVGGCIAAVALIWSGSSSYWAQAWAGLQADGKQWFDPDRLAQPALGHLVDLLLLALPIVLAFWRKWSWRDPAFFLICVIGGLWLLSYNIQRWGVITIHVAAVVAAEQLIRRMELSPQSEGTVVNRGGITLYFAAFVLPTIVHCGLALSLHVGTAALRAGEPLRLERVSNVYLADLWPGGDQRGAIAYTGLVGEALSLLEKQQPPLERFAVLGCVDAFSTSLDLTPATGVQLDMRWPVIAAGGSAAPDRILRDADTILVRKSGELASGLPAIYMTYVTAHFSQADETTSWILYRRTGEGQAM